MGAGTISQTLGTWWSCFGGTHTCISHSPYVIILPKTNYSSFIVNNTFPQTYHKVSVMYCLPVAIKITELHQLKKNAMSYCVHCVSMCKCWAVKSFIFPTCTRVCAPFFTARCLNLHCAYCPHPQACFIFSKKITHLLQINRFTAQGWAPLWLSEFQLGSKELLDSKPPTTNLRACS